MTTRASWRTLLMAFGLGAGFGATQMGLGYGLGIIAWVTPGAAQGVATDEAAWVASLTWAAWAAATSVVAGAVCADRLHRTVESGVWTRMGLRTATALAAALGALITVPLVAVPARAAQLSTNFAPHLLAGVYAITGVVVGLIAALGALAARPVAANVLASMVWLWGLGAITVTDAVASGRGVAFAQLGVWKFTTAGPTWHSFYIPGALLMLAAALLIGGLATWPAARRGDNRVGIAVSGAVGPLIVAGAYFLAAPAFGEAPAEQVSAYLTAPYAVLAGLAGSVLVAAVATAERNRPVTTRAERAAARAAAKEAARESARDSGWTYGGSEWGSAAGAKVPAQATGLPASVTGKASVPAASRAYPD